MQVAVTLPLSSGLAEDPSQMHMRPQEQQQLHMPVSQQQPAAPPEGSPFSVLLNFANAEALSVVRSSCLQLVHERAAVTARAAGAPVAELLPFGHLPPDAHASNLTTSMAQVFWPSRIKCGLPLLPRRAHVLRTR